MQVSAPDRDLVRSLAELRLDRPVVLSLYLNLDPSQFATPPARKTAVRSLVDEAERRLRERNGLSHDDKLALQAALERATGFLENELPSDGAHGLAVFASEPSDLFEALKLPRSVPNRVAIGHSPLVGPLARLARRERWCVTLVNRRDARILRGSPDGLREVEQIHDDVSGQHDQGGWSQARYQRHIDKLVHDHLKEVAELVDRQLRRLRGPRVIVVATDETRSEFENALSNDVKKAVIGWTAADAHATAAELLGEVQPLLESWRGEQETRAVERWREETGRNGRAAAGWRQTLEAASDGRIELLLFQEGADRPAWECPACGRVGADGGACPLDGTAMEQRREGLDLAVRQTLAHGGTVWALAQRRDLEPVEGIGALLRF
ncbi:MAG: Vms1/Ankzf1 family peptidyl-tRNA hydrolase [Gaiellaceae bacterium]